MAVGHPLYQNQANALADTLAELAADIRLYPETFSLEEREGSDGTRYYDLNLEAEAGYFALNIEARGFKTNVDAWQD
jgi:hypothetical protein